MKSATRLLFVLIVFAAVPTFAAEKLDLWLFYATNLQVDKNVDDLEPIWRRAAAAGYSKILLGDSKFARLGGLGVMEKTYFHNIARVRKLAADLKLDIIPGVFPIGYSNDLLWHDPNLAEGVPVKDALFVVHGGKAQIVADPPVALGRPVWSDPQVAIRGSVATIQTNPENARLVWRVEVSPFRCYHVSVSIKSDHFTGRPEIKALAEGGMSLQEQSIPFTATQDWTRCDVVFDSLDHKVVNVYLGVWGASTGTLQFKDWKIEEAGLTNVLRRPGAPCIVKADGNATKYVEGRDYDPIKDPDMGVHPWSGSYDSWHESPVITTKLAEGSRLRVSWYYPPIVYDGQVAACFDEPATLELMADQARRMKAAWNSPGYMMSYDEIRVMNWDESCQKKKMTPGRLLATNARYGESLLKGSTAYTWSDMFDPNHNAHDNYYLVNGDLAGSWEGLSRNVVIFNWNFGQRDKSLKFFELLGHKQVIAGYYDSDIRQIKDWLTSAAKVKGVTGVMYTTWANNYADLEEFARMVKK